MKPEEYEILDLIPQRPPMVMIDKLTHSDEKIGQRATFDKGIKCVLP